MGGGGEEARFLFFFLLFRRERWMRFWTISSEWNLLENGNCLGNCGVETFTSVSRATQALSLSLFLYDWSSVKMDLKEEGGVLTSFVIEYL